MVLNRGLTLLELMKAVEERKVSHEEIAAFFRGRIAKHNSELNIFLSTSEGEDGRGTAISGIPLAFKDNICTVDSPTTAASKVLDGYISPYNATLVDRLAAKGHGLLGKVNLDAWAHGSSTETSDYGTSKNPHNVTRSPGGSSGGSAAAVAAYLSPAAIGTETAGSIRLPASWCGVVGLKPTYGRVSRYGVIAMGSSWDCPGPITLSVKDAAYLLSIIAGKDQRDATSVDVPFDDYLTTMQTERKLTIGVPEIYFEGAATEITSQVNAMIEALGKKGHTIKKISLMSPDVAVSVYMVLQRAEVSSNLARYDGVRYGQGRDAFGHEAKKRILTGTYALSHGYVDQYYVKASQVRKLIADEFASAFADVDVIIAPTTPVTALPIGSSADYPFFGELMDKLLEPSSAAGIPALQIPIGYDSQNLPIGIQIMGNHFDETTLLMLGQQIEDIAKETYTHFAYEKYE